MFNDIKRHIIKNKITVLILVAYSLYTFFDKNGFSLFSVVFGLGNTVICFLLFSWGNDNPEERNKK